MQTDLEQAVNICSAPMETVETMLPALQKEKEPSGEALRQVAHTEMDHPLRMAFASV